MSEISTDMSLLVTESRMRIEWSLTAISSPRTVWALFLTMMESAPLPVFWRGGTRRDRRQREDPERGRELSHDRSPFSPLIRP
ncbi:MAG: hypothetical protein MZU84_05920 [Sphingobacterium sp.]|nr:hypothetical protein [Sphingobacterium sp.]